MLRYIYATCFVLQSCQNVFSLEMSWNINKLNFDPSFIILLLLFVVVVKEKKYNCAYLEVLIGLYFDRIIFCD